MSAAAPASARDVLARYRADPTAFCEEVLHFTPGASRPRSWRASAITPARA
jgi:hypothetical protein